MQIPLLIARPGQKQVVSVFSPTSCVDLLPTLMHLSGKAIPDWCEGEILPTFGKAESNPERRIFAVEAKSNPKAGPLKKGTIAMISDPYKLISYSDRERQRVVYELYDLRNDPEKMEDLSAVGKQVVAGLKAEMAARLDVKKPAPLEKNADRG